MPRYRFHVYNDDYTVDRDGQDFPDLKAARAHAIQGARGIMAEELTVKGEFNLSHWIEIEDERGEMNVVSFRDAVKIER